MAIALSIFATLAHYPIDEEELSVWIKPSKVVFRVLGESKVIKT